MIIKINPERLGQKMKWEDLVKTKIFEELIKDASEEGKVFLKDPRPSGIDLNQGIFVLLPANTSSRKAMPIFYGTPKDTGQFAAMVKKLMPGKPSVKIANGKLIINKKTAVAWNKDIFVITGDDSKELPTRQAAKSKASDEAERMKQFNEKCKTLLSKPKSIFTNEHFTALLKEEGDMYLWMSNNIQSQMQKKSKAPQIVEMLNKNIMRSGDYTSGVINFENGRILMQMKRFMSPSVDSIYRKYPAKNLNTEFVRRLPGGQPIFLYTFSFSPEMIRETLAKAGAEKYIDSLSKKKLKIDDIVSAVRGDAVIALMKVYEFSEEDSVTQAMGGMQLFFAGSVNDKQKFNDLSALLQAKKEDTAKNQPTKKMKPLIFSNDSIFVVSLSQIAAQKFLQSAASNEEMEKLIDPYREYPNALIIDLKTIFSFALQGMSKNKSEDEVRQMSEVLGMFDKLISYGGQYQSGYVSTTIELKLTKNENSLKQFIDLLELFRSIGDKKYGRSLPDVEKKQ